MIKLCCLRCRQEQAYKVEAGEIHVGLSPVCMYQTECEDFVVYHAQVNQLLEEEDDNAT